MKWLLTVHSTESSLFLYEADAYQDGWREFGVSLLVFLPKGTR